MLTIRPRTETTLANSSQVETHLAKASCTCAGKSEGLSALSSLIFAASRSFMSLWLCAGAPRKCSDHTKYMAS